MEGKLKYLENEKVRVQAAKILGSGGVVILPSDTLYGISTAISSEEGYLRILKLKKCKEKRNFLLLADSLVMIERYIASWGSADKDVLSGIWPAPLTAILPSGGKSPGWAGDSIAFRIPAYDPVRDVISKVGEPILSTSVNLSGKAPLHRVEEIVSMFGGKVDFLAASKSPTQDIPSTIVDFTQSKPRLIRSGSYPWKDGLGNPSNSRSL